MPPSPERADEYESFYREFDSPLMRQIRLEAYGEDIGQHSWVSADELRGDAVRLGLNKSSGLLDLGSGPCGPLTFLVDHSGCTGVGLELSPSAIEVGRSRAVALGIEARFSARVADLNEPLPPDLGAFDSVVAIDVVLHLHDRLALFREVAKVLRPGGLFLFTDAGIVTGALTSEDVRRRSIHGYTQFVPAGWNERLLRLAGFGLLESEDRTESVVRNAHGRLRAMHNHREDVERLSGVASFAKQVEYTNIVADLAARGSLSRFMYLAKVEQTAG
jgi:SAM-dependent methyltransferase